ncbi:MAG: hypothetical protein Q7K40_03855 [bacterium]|nr:hypothetical protein [bacterium]
MAKEITIPRACKPKKLPPFDKATHECCHNCTPITESHCGHDETENYAGNFAV